MLLTRLRGQLAIEGADLVGELGGELGGEERLADRLAGGLQGAAPAAVGGQLLGDAGLEPVVLDEGDVGLGAGRASGSSRRARRSCRPPSARR
jgi:hypothetical protein